MTDRNASDAASVITHPSKPLGHYQIGFHTFLLFVAVFIVLHNTLVLVLHHRRKTLRSVTNLILVSTACADLMTGLLLIPLLVCSAALSGRGPILNPLYFTSNAIADFLTIAIVGNLLLVTTERYVSLCHPYTYPLLARRSIVKMAVCSLWLLSFVLAVVPLIWSYDAVTGKGPSKSQPSQIYSVILLVTVFFLPSGIILFFLASMYKVVKRFASQDVVRGLRSKEPTGSQRKAIIVFLAMFINLLICWSPMIIVRLIMDTNLQFSPGKVLLEILFTLRCSSSFINPVIYVWCKEDFKLAIKATFFNISSKAFRDSVQNSNKSVNALKLMEEAKL